MKPSLRSKAGRLLRWVRMLPLILAGCGGLAPAQHAEREACLVEVFRQMDARAEGECFARGFEWADCPARDHIMADYQAKQRSCPNAR
jgi:hypothetical protein